MVILFIGSFNPTRGSARYLESFKIRRHFTNFKGFMKTCFAVYIGIKFAFEDKIMGFILAIETAHKFNWVEIDFSLLGSSFQKLI